MYIFFRKSFYIVGKQRKFIYGKEEKSLEIE